MIGKLYSSGFSLVEMAVVLIIVGLLLGGLLVPLTAQIDIRNYGEARKSMNDAQEALMGYAMTNGYLPCPAISSSNGAEDRTAGVCNSRSGHLPWAALGLPKLDSWGHLYRYSVTPAYANSATKITLLPTLTSADITIQTRDSSGALVNLTSANVVPFAVVSMGKNGSSAFNDDGSQNADVSGTNIDEDVNAAGSTTFISRTIATNAASGGGEFDDLVNWIPSSVYVSKLVTAGQLP